MQKTFFALKGTHFFLSATILSAEFINRLLKLHFCGGNIFRSGVFRTKKENPEEFSKIYTNNLRLHIVVAIHCILVLNLISTLDFVAAVEIVVHTVIGSVINLHINLHQV